MKIYYTTDKSDSLYHYATFLLGLSTSDTSSFPIADFIRSANSWARKAGFRIWRKSSIWEFDDSNNTTEPIATTTLVDGQQTYNLETTILDLERVEVKDSNGDYQRLEQIDKGKIDAAMTEFYETAGMPAYYDIIGSTIFLYPKPSASEVTTTAGLKVYLARDISAFATTDTTKEPGMLPIFHPYIAFGSAFDYAVARAYSPQKIQALQLGISQYESSIDDYYAKRDKVAKIKITPRNEGTGL